MFLPFRAKNPPESVPYATYGLIGLNALIYLLTADYSRYGLSVTQWAVDNLAISDEKFSVWRIFTSMFLHENIEHIAGNMLFLWIFGASVEGRLKSAKYVTLYLLSGVIGDLMFEAFQGIVNPAVYSLGASGAIMGVAGAYLYMFPYSTIRIFRFRLFPPMAWISEWHARWVIALYVGLDILSAFLAHGDGVGHFAHIGGFGTGFLFCVALKPRKDSEHLSNVQATRSDVKDPSLLATHELEQLLEHPTDNVAIILAYCEKCIVTPGADSSKKSLRMMTQYQSLLIEKADPNRVAHILLHIPKSDGAMQSVFYLKLGSKLEGAAQYEPACRIYRQIYDLNPHSLDSEVALYRIGRIMERTYQDYNQAIVAYTEMLRLFPAGRMAEDGQRALQGLGHGAPILPPELRASIRSSSGTQQPMPRPTPQPKLTADSQPSEASAIQNGGFPPLSEREGSRRLARQSQT